MLALHVEKIGAAVQPKFPVDIGNEIRQCLMHAGKILTVEAAFDVGVGPHAEKHRIELVGDLLEGNIAADLDIQSKFDAHAFHDFAALLHHVLFQLERRDAEGQQAADLGIAIEDHRFDAVAHQDVGAGETRGPRTHHRHALTCAHHIRHIRFPAQSKGLVGNVFFDGADAHRPETVVQRAGALAQPVLRTNAAAHFGQRIGLMRQFRGFEQFSVVDQRQPIRNVVVHRAFPFAKGIAAGDAAAGLLSGRFGAVLRIDLAKLLGAHLDAELVRILARNIEELQMLVGHGDMRRALSGAAQIFQQRIDRRGLRLDHPKSADIGAKIIEQLRAPVAAGGIDMPLDEAA